MKNTLIFLPLVAAGRIQAIPQGIIAFFAFSFAASIVYLVNDLIDIEADRLHPTKKLRPLACGALSVKGAWMLIALFAALMLTTLLALRATFALSTLAYLTLNALYNLILKKHVMIDIIALVGMYLIRIIAGSVATSIPLTPWFLIFIFFFLLNIAAVKRYGELNFTTSKRRGYLPEDQLPLLCFGIGCSLISPLIFALYLGYTKPDMPMLLFTLPLILYWNMRVWIKTYRGQMNDDPFAFALKDRTSYSVLIGFLLIYGAARAV